MALFSGSPSPSTVSTHHHRSQSRRRRQSSPKNELRQKETDTETKVHHTSKKSSHYERKKSIPKVNTTNLPDLRVDFFSNSIDLTHPHDMITLDSVKNANNISSSVCLNRCLRDVGARLECALTTPCSSIIGHNNINVTTNPLDSSSVHSTCLNSIPQATIVVQQPSLSLDSSSNISTMLLKNGVEFLSNVNAQLSTNSTAAPAVGLNAKSGTNKSTKRKEQQQREENMKQLLEVANTLTLEELHDFEMR